MQQKCEKDIYTHAHNLFTYYCKLFFFSGALTTISKFIVYYRATKHLWKLHKEMHLVFNHLNVYIFLFLYWSNIWGHLPWLWEVLKDSIHHFNQWKLSTMLCKKLRKIIFLVSLTEGNALVSNHLIFFLHCLCVQLHPAWCTTIYI